ncbi:septum site-determining protein MinC [Deltaproteobacteria bacterium TL4]
MQSKILDKVLVEIKGQGGALGLLIDQDSPFEALVQELKSLLGKETSKKFFKGSHIVLRAGSRNVSHEEYAQLVQILQEEGDIVLCKELPSSLQKAGGDKQDRSSQEKISVGSSTAKNEDFPERISEIVAERVSHNQMQESAADELDSPTDQIAQGIASEEALVIKQTLRSGQKVTTSQSLLVLGDINPGAEVISEKDVYVLGTIRGMVHAGARGNKKSVIIGLKIQSGRLGIAQQFIQVTEKSHQDLPPGPKMVYLEHAKGLKTGKIVIDLYHKYR